MYDENGKLITKTIHKRDNDSTYTPFLPFSFMRRSSDYSRSMSATFSLFPGEKIYGCGESFTGLVYLPGDGEFNPVRLQKSGESYALLEDPLADRVKWKIKMANK